LAATEKYSRYRWKEGREKDLWTFVDGKVRDGASVTAALKEYGKRHNMSWLTARWKYYQVRKREVQPETPAPPSIEVTEPTPPGIEDDLIANLSEFVTASRDSGEDVLTMIRGLSRMASLSKESAKIMAERDRHQTAMRENAVVLREVREFIAEWLSMSQVDRVATLKAFSDRLAGEADRLGAVGERLAAHS